MYLQQHHVLPKSWGGRDNAENLVHLCGTGHDTVHWALNQIVHYGSPEEVPWPLRRAAGVLWAMALDAWDEHHGDTPYTQANPGSDTPVVDSEGVP